MTRLLPMLVLSALGTTAVAQEPADPCAAFSWNIAHERALFATAATARDTGVSGKDAPLLDPDHLYELQLHPLADVHFTAPPGKSKGGNGPHAGLATLRVPMSGLWRVALDQAAWIDVVATSDGQSIASSEYQGRPGCHAPHKIVQFQLPANQDLLIQLSGTPEMQVRLTVTRGEPSAK